jgi:hypothetical protein
MSTAGDDCQLIPLCPFARSSDILVTQLAGRVLRVGLTRASIERTTPSGTSRLTPNRYVLNLLTPLVYPFSPRMVHLE